MDFLGGVWVFTWRTEGPQAYVPIERTHGIHSGNILFYLNGLLIARLFAFRHLGGILGWDPVLTTCILGKILERIGTSHETQHGNHRVDHEKYCEAIYWKYHTSHLLTKIYHTITFKTFFFNKNTILIGNK